MAASLDPCWEGINLGGQRSARTSRTAASRPRPAVARTGAAGKGAGNLARIPRTDRQGIGIAPSNYHVAAEPRTDHHPVARSTSGRGRYANRRVSPAFDECREASNGRASRSKTESGDQSPGKEIQAASGNDKPGRKKAFANPTAPCCIGTRQQSKQTAFSIDETPGLAPLAGTTPPFPPVARFRPADRF